MELDAFVEKVLTQIIGGIKKAQESSIGMGAVVNPSFTNWTESSGTTLYSNNPNGLIQEVEFDIAVTEAANKTTKGGGGANLKVVSLGVGSDSASSHESTNRIRFKVPVFFPTQSDN